MENLPHTTYCNAHNDAPRYSPTNAVSKQLLSLTTQAAKSVFCFQSPSDSWLESIWKEKKEVQLLASIHFYVGYKAKSVALS